MRIVHGAKSAKKSVPMSLNHLKAVLTGPATSADFALTPAGKMPLIMYLRGIRQAGESDDDKRDKRCLDFISVIIHF